VKPGDRLGFTCFNYAPRSSTGWSNATMAMSNSKSCTMGLVLLSFGGKSKLSLKSYAPGSPTGAS
jgi:hypothetical protein